MEEKSQAVLDSSETKLGKINGNLNYILDALTPICNEMDDKLNRVLGIEPNLMNKELNMKDEQGEIPYLKSISNKVDLIKSKMMELDRFNKRLNDFLI